MKFAPGQEFERNGVQYRVLSGDRCEGDMVLEFRVAGWHRPTIAHSLIAIEFKFQVEQNNYGPNGKLRKGGRGGWMLIDAIKEACRYGWESVAERILGERERAARRREGST
jgi:hypothetical protein